MERVFVTGMGVRTPLGSDPEELWARLLKGESSSSEWPDLVAEGFPVPRACRIGDDLGEPDPARRGRALARLAAGAALEHAALAPGGRVGVYVGTTMGESRVFEDAGEGTELDLAAAAGNVFAAEVAAAFALEGPQRTYGTACAAGNYAIGAAAAAVRSGAVDVALAGGVEPFSRLALLGFARSRAMSSDVCRPFDRGRTGMQLGEAAAFLVLERGGAGGAPRGCGGPRSERRRLPSDRSETGRLRHGGGDEGLSRSPP